MSQPPPPKSIIVALELFRAPTLADALRRDGTLPEGMTELIRIAGGCRPTIDRISKLSRRPPDLLVQASQFYLTQVIFASEADNYRILGLIEDAPQEKISEHGRWLMRWLHPDSSSDLDWHTDIAARIMSAWNEIKTVEKRRSYDALERESAPIQQSTIRHTSRPPIIFFPETRHDRTILGTFFRTPLLALSFLIFSTTPAPDRPMIYSYCATTSAALYF